MKIKPLKWVCILGLMAGLVSCGVDMPKVVNTSFETIVVERQDITVPVKFSAKLKGEADVVISPQVSGQLMQICVASACCVLRLQAAASIINTLRKRKSPPIFTVPRRM